MKYFTNVFRCVLLTFLSCGIYQAHALDVAGGEITTQMLDQRSGLDDSRYFIFDFSFVNQTGNKRDNWCQVETIIINNADCDSPGMGGTGSDPVWLKREMVATDYSGEVFCNLEDLGGDRKQLSYEYSDFGGPKITHRFILEGRKMVDYVGGFSKYSDITQQLESVNFIPLRADDHLGYKEVRLCQRFSLPGLK